MAAAQKRYSLFGWLLLVWLVAGGGGRVHAQALTPARLPTRAEASDFEETTRYDGVLSFIETVTEASDQLHQTYFGYTTEGRKLPLVVYGDVENAQPEAVRRSGKTRVFIQANIHAGEVCGKEALLMLLRELANGEHAAWADSLVILAAPIYNADGNERVSLYHRRLQHGPIGGMGTRANARDYDLNRDHMKLDTPEARSLVRLFRRYDPHVVVDLHTTDGTHHGYHLTYSSPLHPSTAPAIIDLLRSDWLPAVTQAVKEKHGWDYYYYYYYGNVAHEGSDRPQGWYTFSHRPRFNNNYVGLRGRFAILSEAYAYATFKERIQASQYFVEEILNYARAHAGTIRSITQRVDEQSVVGEEIALQAEHERSEDPTTILMGEVEREANPYSGAPILHRKNVQQPVQMYEYGIFAPTEVTRAPAVYYVPDSLDAVINRLGAHGVTYRTLEASRSIQVQRFRLDSVRIADEPYQKHRQQTLFGAYEPAQVTLAPGTLVVPVDQPLGRLVVMLLEPRSDDGFANWGIVKNGLRAAAFYPVLRRSAAP